MIWPTFCPAPYRTRYRVAIVEAGPAWAQVARNLALACAILGLAGCAPTADPAACVAFAPIRPTEADVRAISPGLAAAILAHDRTGEALCGWKPAR